MTLPPDPDFDTSTPLVPDETRRLLNDIERRRRGESDPPDLATHRSEATIRAIESEAQRAEGAPATPPVTGGVNVFDRLAQFTTHTRPRYAKALVAVALGTFIAGGGMMLKNSQSARPQSGHSLERDLEAVEAPFDTYHTIHGVATRFGASVRMAAQGRSGLYANGVHAGEEAVYDAWFTAISTPDARLAIVTAKTESGLRWHDGAALLSALKHLQTISNGDTDSRALLIKAAVARHFELVAPDAAARARWQARARQADAFAVTNGHTINSGPWRPETGSYMQQALAMPARQPIAAADDYKRGYAEAMRLAYETLSRMNSRTPPVAYSLAR